MSTTDTVTTAESRLEIVSASLGPLSVEAKDLIEFREPVLGFPDTLRYVLIPHTLPDGSACDAIQWLQAMDSPFQAFILTDPWTAFFDYAPEISDQDAADLELTRFEDAKVMAIMTVREGEPTTVNLRAPIVFNVPKRLGKQTILLSDQYHSRHTVG